MDFELTEEQRMIRDTAARLCREQVAPLAAQIDAEERWPEENFRALADMGVFGITISEEYGGSGGDFLSCVLVMEELAKACVSTANTYGSHAVLCTENIFRNGSKAQREKYVPPLVAGEKIGAICITEPEAGSDALSMRTRAEKKGDRYVINGTKMFITNGPNCDTAVVYAKTDPEAGAKGISAFIVESSFPGFSRGRKLEKMGVRGSWTGELIFEDMEVPAENLLGEENKGLRVLMSGLDRERILYSIAPIGVAQAAFDAAWKYCGQRVQFGSPLIGFQLVQGALADIAARVQAGRVLCYWAAQAADSGERCRLEASYAKLFGAQVGVECVGRAMELFGGYGFIREFPIERMYRDVKGIEFGAGTSNIQRMIIVGEMMKQQAGS